jgi:hypothetical protein
MKLFELIGLKKTKAPQSPKGATHPAQGNALQI